MPSADQQCDTIQISGPATKVEAARQALLGRVTELEKEREDRALRNFAVNVCLSDYAWQHAALPPQVSNKLSIRDCQM